MAKATKKKAKAAKKSARVTAKPRAAARSAKPAKKKAAKPSKPATRKTAAPKIDPLNRKQYAALTPMIAGDVRKAADFYTKAFGFSVRGIMDSPQGAIHAELRLRDTTLMLSPEAPTQGNLSANSIGNTPATLYVLVEHVDGTFNAAVAAGGKVLMPVMDMFWGDRCAMIGDPDGNKWMIATHKTEPTEAQMAEAMSQAQQSGEAASAGGESEY
jgi:uncharacterized glyoxalase superfamily protein PhnB